jgi:outer membrane protein OmpA-like peptidoglycan-associated protein
MVMSLLKQNSGRTAGMAVAVLMLAGAGCATKGFVTKKVEPLDTRVAEVEGRTSEHSAELAKLNEKDGELARDVSRVSETAEGAQGAADSAAQRAGEAQQRADSGYDLAEKGRQRSDELEEGLGNVHNYQLITSESIQFGFDSSELNPDVKNQIEDIVRAAANAKDYVIELKGFTDTTGSPKYNLALSERRAQAVVRHLTLEGKVPLYRIHLMGFGSESPVADNKSRDGRQQNRRVEISVYKAGSDIDTTSARTASQTF